MALGSTPTLSQIKTELGSSNNSLTCFIAEAGKTGVWNKQSDFAGYSHAYLTINPTYTTVASTPDTHSFSISSNSSWTISESEAWIFGVSPTSGSGNATINYNVGLNKGGVRIGFINVNWVGSTRSLEVTQLEGIL